MKKLFLVLTWMCFFSTLLIAQSAQNLLFEGLGYVKTENYEKAIDAFTKLIKVGSKSEVPSAYALRASCYLNLEKYDNSLDDINKAIQLDPLEKSFWSLRGSINFRAENIKEAEKDYSKFFDMGGGDNNAQFILACIKYRLDDLEGSINECKKFLGFERNSRVLVLLVLNYFEKKDWENATLYYNKFWTIEDPEKQSHHLTKLGPNKESITAIAAMKFTYLGSKFTEKVNSSNKNSR